MIPKILTVYENATDTKSASIEKWNVEKIIDIIWDRQNKRYVKSIFYIKYWRIHHGKYQEILESDLDFRIQRKRYIVYYTRHSRVLRNYIQTKFFWKACDRYKKVDPSADFYVTKLKKISKKYDVSYTFPEKYQNTKYMYVETFTGKSSYSKKILHTYNFNDLYNFGIHNYIRDYKKFLIMMCIVDLYEKFNIKFFLMYADINVFKIIREFYGYENISFD